MRMPAFLRVGRSFAMLGTALLLGSCQKDEAFFTMVGVGNGSVDIVVDGTPDGATVQITGDGVNETDVVDESPRVFAGLNYGTYQVTVTPPAGYTCDPLTQTVVVSESTPDIEVDFTCFPALGGFRLTTTGLGSGVFLDATLTGPVNRNGQLSTELLEFLNLPIGNYNWSIGQAVGWNCLPSSGNFSVAAGQLIATQLDCNPTEGGLSVTVTGATANVSYSGPESGGSAAGATPVVFPGLTPGNYTVNISSPLGFNCTPPSQPAAVTAGATASVQFICAPLPGTVTATVTGATAQVNYTGAASGGAPVGSTPVPFTGLPAGSYNFAIVEPDDFDCTPAAIPVNLAAGGSESVQFSCTAANLVEHSVDLAGFQAGPGAVASGTYPATVRDALLVAVATMAIQTIGLQTFYGITPDRLGFDGSSGYQLDTFFQVGALFFTVRALQVCAINAALSGSNFLALTYYSAALVLLTSAAITSTGCFWLDVPAGTRFIRMMGPAAGFVDIHNIRLRGFMAT